MRHGPAPSVRRLTLGRVTAVPPWHPEHATFAPFPVHGWVVRHPAGVVLVDTGIGTGNAVIDEWYRPEVVPVADALAPLGIEPADVAAVVLSHLHFDHCGQQHALAAPVFVQASEHEAAQEAHYTVREWADVDAGRLRLLQGDEEIAPGVRVVATPGHTPGHQSVVVDTADGTVAIAAQCAFRAEEVLRCDPAAANLHAPAWADAARASLGRLRDLRPVAVHLSHDERVVAVAPGR